MTTYTSSTPVPSARGSRTSLASWPSSKTRIAQRWQRQEPTLRTCPCLQVRNVGSCRCQRCAIRVLLLGHDANDVLAPLADGTGVEEVYVVIRLDRQRR